MNDLFLSPVSTMIVGLGATLTFDLWGLFLKYVFKIAPSDFCLVGRWVLYMPKGIFKHRNISATPRKSTECVVGWFTHYLTGILFAIAFVAQTGNGWLQHPTPTPALTFGVVTVSIPFFIMQPAFGLGVAASKTAKPMQARVRSLVNHLVFGLGLFIFGLLASWLI
ncbi:MAG TPA: DUF2938 domain-containing protein [Anaerolineales bacterium]|nr:DUF2938 domain-containing protein [Anaerolineales bacterium]HNJ14343.1 DUF2938 domain-containing protein [Anaerolineales bacterium]HNN14553.1 DUF2938 domain-containing protein [Anaerolineales bacterium]